MFEYLKLYFHKFGNNNSILGSMPKLKKSKIVFHGKNNVLYCDGKVTIQKSTLHFNGDNSLIFLCEGIYRVNVLIHNNSTLYIGRNNYFNPGEKGLNIILSEHKNVFIGNGNLFSTGITIRNADPHLIYDIVSGKRINDTKSCYIGDHIWIGYNVSILKGVHIHSGSIVGANSVLANKKLSSNRIYAGNPVRLIRENIFWSKECVHAWDNEKTIENAIYKGNIRQYMAPCENKKLSFNAIEKVLEQCDSAWERYKYLKRISQETNRFVYDCKD